MNSSYVHDGGDTGNPFKQNKSGIFCYDDLVDSPSDQDGGGSNTPYQRPSFTNNIIVTKNSFQIKKKKTRIISRKDEEQEQILKGKKKEMASKKSSYYDVTT